MKRDFKFNFDVHVHYFSSYSSDVFKITDKNFVIKKADFSPHHISLVEKVSRSRFWFSVERQSGNFPAMLQNPKLGYGLSGNDKPGADFLDQKNPGLNPETNILKKAIGKIIFGVKPKIRKSKILDWQVLIVN